MYSVCIRSSRFRYDMILSQILNAYRALKDPIRFLSETTKYYLRCWPETTGEKKMREAKGQYENAELHEVLRMQFTVLILATAI